MFADNSTDESMRLAAKFTTILSEIIADPQNNLELESIITDDKSDLISKPNNSAIIVSKIDCISEFDVGLVIGIIAGIIAEELRSEYLSCSFLDKKIPQNRTRFITNLSSIPA